MAETRRRCWSRLPPELLSKIAASLEEITDRIRFGSICKHWNSASKWRTVLSQPSLPWLLLPSSSSTDTSADINNFLSLSENKIYTGLHLPRTYRTAIYQSSHGYLLTQDRFGIDKTLHLHLLNPVTGHLSPLPPLPRTSYYYDMRLWRLVTGPQSTILMLSVCMGPIYLIEKQQAGPDWGRWREMADVATLTHSEFNFHKGSFFVLDCWLGETFVVDPHSLKEVSHIPRAVSHVETLGSQYLVESSSGDELFMVIKSMGSQLFEVFRLLGERKWVKVRSIGEDMMFVDDRNAVALSARDFNGRRGNCIYFVNIGAHAPGLFDIESGQVEDLLPHWWDDDDDSVSRWKYQTQSWIMPTMLLLE